MAETVIEAIEELIDMAHSSSAVKQNLEKIIQENNWNIGPNKTETLVIFNNMRTTLADASVVLDNLKRLHKGKTDLRTAMKMFKTATSPKPQADKSRASFLIGSMTGSFNTYTRHYETYINERNHELVYSSRDSPKTYTNIIEWLHHLIEEHVHQGQGGEPLLDISSITKDEYIKALETFAVDNGKEPLDKTTSNISNVGISNLSSASKRNKGNGIHVNSSKPIIIENETSKRSSTEGPRQEDQTSTSQGNVHFQRDETNLMPTRQSASSNQNLYDPL